MRFTKLLGLMLLAAAALFGAGAIAGWQGVMLVVCLFVGWLLMQFRRLMRVMDEAGRTAPGSVSDATGVAAQVHPGMKLEDLIALTHSFGAKVEGAPGTYTWSDAAGTRLEVKLDKRRVADSRLVKPAP